MSRCIRCLVSGRVQGVWYRGSARREAEGLGITGHARNLPDGRVEVLACGEESALRRFKEWLWQGPVAAEVTEVNCEPLEITPPADFQTG